MRTERARIDYQHHAQLSPTKQSARCRGQRKFIQAIRAPVWRTLILDDDDLGLCKGTADGANKSPQHFNSLFDEKPFLGKKARPAFKQISQFIIARNPTVVVSDVFVS